MRYLNSRHLGWAAAFAAIVALTGFSEVIADRPRGAQRRCHRHERPILCTREKIVDPMFRSAAEVYGNAALGVVLTGMGHDGRDGAEQMVKAGALILAQDEASSVVWGMPGSVVQAGLAEHIKPINQIGSTIMNIISGGNQK